MFRVLYFTTFLLFLFSAPIFWAFTDEFFSWLYGFNTDELNQTANVNRSALEHTVSIKENFILGIVLLSTVCLFLSILAISTKMRGRVIAYLSLLMSAITIMMFIVSFFGHGVIPTRGII